MMTSGTDRVSIELRPSNLDSNEHYSWMFKEDFVNGCVPIIQFSQKNFDCRLIPKNPDFQLVLSQAFPSNYHSYRGEDLNEIIQSIIRYIAYNLVNYGCIVLELIEVKDFKDEISYKFVPVYGEVVKVKRKKIIQIIPALLAKELEISRTVEIPKEKCFVIEFPEILGGKKEYLKFLSEFEDLGRQSPMMNYRNDPLANNSNYDLLEHQKMHKIELWSKSKKFNWNHRGNEDSLFSSYYYVYRYLNFKKAKFQLRDYIIDQTKELVVFLSKKLDYNLELTVEGLIPIKEIDERLEEWNSGQINRSTFNDIL